MFEEFDKIFHTTLTNFSTEYLVMMGKVYTHVGGIK